MSSLRERLDAAKRESRRVNSGGKLLFSTPDGEGGSDTSLSAAVFPCVHGKEIVWVKHPQLLCGGRIGNSSKGCLKSVSECDVESHERSKCNFPTTPFLVLMVSATVTRGYENIILESTGLESSFVTSLLGKTKVNWAKEFEEIKSNNSKTVQDREISKEIVQTARKQTSFQTPAKSHAINDFEDKLHDLTSISTLVEDMTKMTTDDDGVRIDRSVHLVDDTTVSKVLEDLYSHIDILAEHAKIVKEVLVGNSDLINGFVKPLESILSGVRLELASFRGDVGTKDLENLDVPPGIWNVVESGFAAIHSLENKLKLCQEKSNDAYEVADFLLGNSSSLKTNLPSNTDNVKSEDSSSKDDGKSFINSLGFGNNDDDDSDKPTIKNGILRPRTNRDKESNDDNDLDDCDKDVTKCSLCMNRMDGIENRLVHSLLRLSNLEETKSGAIESAIMVKQEVFRGRKDIIAWAEKHFPSDKDKSIEVGCFSTPHFILNMMYADMCSKRYATIDLQVKDLKQLEINRPDATAYYAIQTDKPDFMVATSPCPSHAVKASKAERESCILRFIPSFADYGTSSDTESIQHRFKTSLGHIRDKQEKYLESRLEDHPNREVIEIANQLLSDSCKFITNMLEFMEELYCACHDSFGASTEAWELVCHCLDELFTKELKPSLKFSVSQDLGDSRNAFIGVLHSTFSLNVKIRELNHIGLKNHHSTTTSHVRFVMKMAKHTHNKPPPQDSMIPALKHKYEVLETEHARLRRDYNQSNATMLKSIKNLESRLDKFKDAQNKAAAAAKKTG
jgi:hypothetical protein